MVSARYVKECEEEGRRRRREKYNKNRAIRRKVVDLLVLPRPAEELAEWRRLSRKA